MPRKTPAAIVPVPPPPPLEFDFDAALDAINGIEPAAIGRLGTGSEKVVVCWDRSGSMSTDPSGTPGVSRHEIACKAVAPLLKDPNVILIGFGLTGHYEGDSARVVRPDESIPTACETSEWGGGTSLDDALTLAVPFNPGRTVVICDGGTSDQEECFATAETLTGVVDTIFIGRPSDVGPKTFLMALSSKTGGTYTDMGGGMAELPGKVAMLCLPMHGCATAA